MERPGLVDQLRFPRRQRREQPRLGRDPDPPEVEAICIPAGARRRVVADIALVVPRARIDENAEPLVIEREHALRGQLQSKLRCSEAVLGVSLFVEALRVVKEREEKDELRIAALDLTGESEPRPRHRLPVLLAMIARPGSGRPRDDQWCKRRIHEASVVHPVAHQASNVRAVRILITGAAGMLGGKLAERLARDGELAGGPIAHVLLADVVEPGPPVLAGFDTDMVVANLAEEGVAADLLENRPDVIFHLAAVVSAAAERDLEQGYRTNLDGTRLLLDGIRMRGSEYRPRVVFASTIAVFGAPFPEVIGDEQCLTPLTSYGTQKAMAELLLSDYSRRGFLDGIGLRLPTICVRPGTPNAAASGFFSSIIREPLNGKEAVLPVPDDTRHWHASPRAAIGFLIHAATIDTALLGGRRCLTMPGVSVTVAEQIEALRHVAGEEVARRIRREPDEAVMAIVAGWPCDFDARRARALGFCAETDFEEIIRIHIEDELGGTIPGAGV